MRHFSFFLSIKKSPYYFAHKKFSNLFRESFVHLKKGVEAPPLSFWEEDERSWEDLHQFIPKSGIRNEGFDDIRMIHILEQAKLAFKHSYPSRSIYLCHVLLLSNVDAIQTTSDNFLPKDRLYWKN